MESKFRIVRDEDKHYIPQIKRFWGWVDMPIIKVCMASNGQIHVVKTKGDWFFSKENALIAISTYQQFNDVNTVMGLKYLHLGTTYICIDRKAHEKPKTSYGNGKVIYSTKRWSDDWYKFFDDLKDRYVDKQISYVTEQELKEIETKLRTKNG